MAHAWLDSLSEDWVSQPRSDTSQAQLATPSSPPALQKPKAAGEIGSRIPRLNAGKKGTTRSQHVARDNSTNALHERSLIDFNIPSSQRGSLKISHWSKPSYRGRPYSRSVSVSTAGSVIHNTAPHNKSQSASPSKGQGDAPEWKKRLVYGELNYGESRDLFSSAGAGLENIFRPPGATVTETLEEEPVQDEGYTVNETTLPSSPPPYSRSRQNEAQSDENSEQPAEDTTVSPPYVPESANIPKKMTFRRNVDQTDDSSRLEDSTMRGSCGSQDTGTHTPTVRSGNSRQPSNPFAASRQISGQSVVKNEDFSPILISRHSSDDGKVTFAPVELPAHQLRKKLARLRSNQMLLGSETGSDMAPGTVIPDDGTQNFETTEDYAKNGGFLNLRRGGRSAEDSFRRRPLSPPLNTDTSEMLPESSLQASTPKQFASVRTDPVRVPARMDDPGTPLSPVMPRAPHPSPEKRLQPPAGYNGSPLKLFGPYDTFTNQTLLRRISQFEDQLTNSPSHSMPESPSRSAANKGSVPSSSPTRLAPSHGHYETFGAVNSFGAGELDGYEFDEDLSLSGSDPSRLGNKENMTPVHRQGLSNSAFKFEIHQDLSREGESLLVQRQRPESNASSSTTNDLRLHKLMNTSRPQAAPEIDDLNSASAHAPPKRDGSEGKRPRTSPSKDPTPKRRRTLHRSDVAYGLEDRPALIEPVQSSHFHMQSAIENSRKDGLQGVSHYQLAGPSVMELRQTLRPRSPTPSRRASLMRERQPLSELGFDPDDGFGQVPSQARASAKLGQEAVNDGSRKTSMKTQDFFDAAEEIMAMIRNKARPKTELGSVEETEAETSGPRSLDTLGAWEESFQDSTREPFSRPPSRDGAPLPRIPMRQLDPELLDRLKQYEEGSDLGDIISHSLESMGRIKDAIHETNVVNDSIEESIRCSRMRRSSRDEPEIISDLSNIRISRNPDFGETGQNVMEFPSNGSRSSEASTARSVPTGSSRNSNSDSRRLIAPDAVTQLIGDHVGNMVFDKEDKKWRKVKTPSAAPRVTNVLPSEESDEDPFASIPDLTVDTAKETHNLGLPPGPNREDLEHFLQEDISPRCSSVGCPSIDEAATDATSTTRDTYTRIRRTLTETAVEDDEEIEHEISIHEDRMQNSSPARKRRLTITFSSPIASIIQDVALQNSDDDSAERELSLLGKPPGSAASGSLGRGRKGQVRRAVSRAATESKSRSRSRGVHKSLSVKGQVFVPRPVSRIDERDEDSADVSGGHRQVSIRGDYSIVGPDMEDMGDRSLSVVLATPAPPRTTFGGATPIIGQYVGTLSLSPLSEFTMHHADRSCGLEVSYVVGDDYLVTGDGSKKVMSNAIRSLVEKITEVEPFEPEWESMQELDISGKQLDTLHMLDEFCTRLVTLDASRNAIGHLEGVPPNVRNLRVSHNALSELTAWGHLMNLQYVDISDNHVDSLYAFKDLVHLRTLRADNNQITSLDGIKFHDSLQNLRARGNHIEDIDFDGTLMQRLVELDLANNRISHVANIEQLTCLTTLNLQHNCLESFAPSTAQAMPNLRYLKLSGNELDSFDLAGAPLLRLLHLDRNRLTSLTGFSRCHRLDSLSLREQRDGTVLDMSFLDAACEVRKLYLSGNRLGGGGDGGGDGGYGFDPRVDFLNLQYLELANCGLRALPPRLGQLTPNLRVLNVNFNALADLGPLRYVPRLKRLAAAGNRLADAAQVAGVLQGFPHLSALDLRDNPATLGFYPPIQTLVVKPDDDGGGAADGSAGEPFALPDADPERAARFAGRLDLGTRMRRRLYDLVVNDRCPRLRTLDGAPVAPRRAAALSALRDDVWDALVAAGVLDGGGGDDVAEALGEKTEKEKPGKDGEEVEEADACVSSR
ncbi:hypothetical protein GGR56DRAFT_680006 [Xylariaceae sp. FL0804]|nr:hypothetical protein GGR56DRAFT_680006 [Xylariaceae sp. FL0804]